MGGLWPPIFVYPGHKTPAEPGVLNSAGMPHAGKPLAQIAAYAAAHGKLGRICGGFTSSAEVLFPQVHGTFARCHLHGTQVHAGPASLAEIGPHAEGKIHPAVFAPAHKPDGPGLVRFLAHTHAPSAEHAVVVAKWVPDFRDAAPHRNVLDSLGVGRLGDEEFSDVVAQTADPFGIGVDHHAFFRHQSARGRDFGASVHDVLHDAKAAGSYLGHGREVAQVRNTDAVKESRVQNARPFRCAYGRSVNSQCDI